MESIEITVRGGLVNKRLDLAIAAESKLSRRRAKTMIDNGSVFVNGRRQRIASKPLSFGDKLTYEFEPVVKKKTPKLHAHDIIFRQKGVIVINKPAGLPTQASKASDKNQVLPQMKKILVGLGADASGLTLVHRLDKETSGLLILAESPSIANRLISQFRDFTIKKTYHALCYGHTPDSFDVKCKLSSINPQTGTVKVSQKSGKISETKFITSEVFSGSRFSLVSCFPKTGRSHQLRVHLSHSNYSILGDKIYGNRRFTLPEAIAKLASEHHFLHARALEFRLPGEESKSIKLKAPYPETWKVVLEELRKKEVD